MTSRKDFAGRRGHSLATAAPRNHYVEWTRQADDEAIRPLIDLGD